MAKSKRITREQRRDWRTLDYADWNTVTIHAYFADMNRELFGVDEYVPMRNWSFEQGVIKRALDEHGAEILRISFDEIFRIYRPTKDYPLLTAGFAICYRLNTVLPKIKAELERRRAEERGDVDGQDLAGIIDYL